MIFLCKRKNKRKLIRKFSYFIDDKGNLLAKDHFFLNGKEIKNGVDN